MGQYRPQPVYLLSGIQSYEILHIMPHSTFGISVPAFDQPPLFFH